MIKQIPGWLNYLAVFAFYSAIGYFLRWISGSQCEWWFLLLIMSVWAGGYMAKWRYFESEGKWRFW